ncbi:ImmA/IrrE family metallo-endopeptidase [Comamonas terrigena]|uniref:ImmA/IrrE family metallo-endopeptidase n=1 Tax=Comamonas terrigena TaxID=32013 RepID=UPI0028A072D5|nr:ImmA/IrrE family metallo-endopeptidase [Comamonas terrigena]
MSTSDPYIFATSHAESIVKGLKISALPVNPRRVAEELDFVVQAKPVEDRGCSGMLVRYGNNFAIAYATHLQNEGFENFSIAHELGHYYIPGHPEALIPGEQGTHVSRAGFNSGDRYEAEADRFAAGFLMPRHLFFPELEKAGKGLEAIEVLSFLCKTSLHATAIRFAQCTRDHMAIVISEGGTVDHCFMSEALKQVRGIDWLRKGQGLPACSSTLAFNRDPDRIAHAERVQDFSNLQDWFGGRRTIEIREDVVGLGSYGKTLTVLYDIDVPEEEDEDDESRLIGSWTPSFRS